MSRRFIVCDPEKCTGCRLCDFACSIIKEKSFNPLLSRIRTVRLEPDINYALACRFCKDAPCVTSCPRKALRQTEGAGVISVDKNVCDGCVWCIEACDFGALTLNPLDKVVKVCDLCDGEPKCVEFCPKGALSLITSEQISQRARRKAICAREERQ